jgi:hypothetical protein
MKERMDATIFHTPAIVNVFTYSIILFFPIHTSGRKKKRRLQYTCYRQRLHINLLPYSEKKKRNDTDDDENDSKLSLYTADPFSLFEIPMRCPSFGIGEDSRTAFPN